MRTVTLPVAALALIACVETALDTSAGHPANPSANPGPATKAPAALSSGFDPFVAFSAESAAPAGDVAVYTCPMHPEIVRDAPGNCPICGMKLVPKKPSAQPSP